MRRRIAVAEVMERHTARPEVINKLKGPVSRCQSEGKTQELPRAGSATEGEGRRQQVGETVIPGVWIGRNGGKV